MKEHDLVVLLHDRPENGLKAGDVGTVVHMYPTGGGVEVEFARADGETVAVETLEGAALRLFEGPEILHARKLAS